MKKLMIAAAIVCAAVIAQAAQIDWSVATDAWVMNDGKAATAGTSVYLIDYTKASSIITALSADGFEYTSANILAVDGVIDVNTTADAKGTVASKTASGLPASYVPSSSKYDWAFLVVDNTAANGDVFAGYSKGKLSKAVYDPADPTYSTAQSVDFGARQAIENYTLVQAGAVPEPTSGLLLLLGVAGLALKRRRV